MQTATAHTIAPNDLATLPKAHLHLHFAGSMRHTTLLDLARTHGVQLPQSLRSGRMKPVANSPRGWFRFQHLYETARAVIKTPADMQRLVLEAAQDDAAEGSRWLELQIDPSSYAPLAGGLSAALDVVLDAARQASATTACDVAIVVAANRTKHPLEARTLARLAAQHAGTGAGTVVGFGLSNDERSGNTDDFAPAFRIARNAGLRAVPHSGELLGPDHVRQTITALHPDRLGHGVRAAEDPQLLSTIVERNIFLEVCPTSNVSLGVYPTTQAVPLRTLLSAGARITLNADDPLLFGSRLLDQYRDARETHAFTDQELSHVAQCSIQASCMPADRKTELIEQAKAWVVNAAAAPS